MEERTNRQLTRIILASRSPRRLELLHSLHLDVIVVPSEYEEPQHPHLLPRDLAVLHAKHKCEDVRRRFEQGASHVIVAADTVVDVDAVAYDKPRDPDDAKRMLRDLSGRSHIVHTAYAIAIPDRELAEHCESTVVKFFALSDDEIDAYVGSGEPMDKAGAYGIQGYGATLVERIEGDFYTVMGFPLAQFVQTLAQLGFILPIQNRANTPT